MPGLALLVRAIEGSQVTLDLRFGRLLLLPGHHHHGQEDSDDNSHDQQPHASPPWLPRGRRVSVAWTRLDWLQFRVKPTALRAPSAVYVVRARKRGERPLLFLREILFVPLWLTRGVAEVPRRQIKGDEALIADFRLDELGLALSAGVDKATDVQ